MSDSESECSLDTAGMVEVARINTILEEREIRGQLIGAIVKIPTEVLLDDEVIAEHLVQEYVFGAVHNVADVCNHTGDRAVEVNWSIHDRFFSLARNDFGGIVPVWEHEVLPVTFRHEELDVSEEMVDGYFEKYQGKWILTEKRVPLCEHCGKNTCDRMTYRHPLELEIVRLNTTRANNYNKRYTMYRFYTSLKHGHLGQGNRMRVQCCVQALIHEMFPVAIGTVPVGFIVN